jgi:hypothetical protein
MFSLLFLVKKETMPSLFNKAYRSIKSKLKGNEKEKTMNTILVRLLFYKVILLPVPALVGNLHQVHNLLFRRSEN